MNDLGGGPEMLIFNAINVETANAGRASICRMFASNMALGTVLI